MPPTSVVPKDAAEYVRTSRSFVDQNCDVIVTVGFNLRRRRRARPPREPEDRFIGVDQSPICVDATGKQDSTFACTGDAMTLAPNYISLEYQEDQAGLSRRDRRRAEQQVGTIGAIGGTSLCAPCVRYIQGYELGAKSVNPNIKVVSAYVTNDFATGVQRPGHGQDVRPAVHQPRTSTDVLFQVAGKTGNGVLEAACAAGIYGIGVDVDQWLSLARTARNAS